MVNFYPLNIGHRAKINSCQRSIKTMLAPISNQTPIAIEPARLLRRIVLPLSLRSEPLDPRSVAKNRQLALFLYETLCVMPRKFNNEH